MVAAPAIDDEGLALYTIGGYAKKKSIGQIAEGINDDIQCIVSPSFKISSKGFHHIISLYMIITNRTNIEEILIVGKLDGCQRHGNRCICRIPLEKILGWFSV